MAKKRQHEVRVLEDEFDPRTVNGLFVVSSRSPAYPDSVLALDEGLAVLVGEHEMEDGSFARVLDFKERRRNPDDTRGEYRTVRLGAEFFQAPLKEYTEWPLKWWREVIQNSVDAGCSRMVLGTYRNEDGTITVYADDDGRGMNRDTLVDKFLVLGATTKVGEAGKTGGFGKAKELILLPWLSWRIHTRDVEAHGEGAEYRVRTVQARKGTRLEVVMSPDACTTVLAAREFLQRCDIPGVVFEIVDESDPANNETMRATSNVEEMTLIEEGSRFTAYFKPNDDEMMKRWQGWVRINGLFMFEFYVGGLPGQLIIELKGSSLDILHSNRDSIRDRNLRDELSKLQDNISKDTTSALKAKKGHVTKKYTSGSRFSAGGQRKRPEPVVAPTWLPEGVWTPGKRGEEVPVGHLELNAAALANIVAEVGSLRDEASAERMARESLALDQLSAMSFDGDRHLEAALKQLSWEPDFVLHAEVDNFVIPPRFTPEKMTPRVKRLASVWAECCRWVLMQLGSGDEYSVGFVFSRDVRAMYMEEDNENWLLLNPFGSKQGLRILDSIHYGTTRTQKLVEKELLEETFQVTERRDFQLLYALAVHECTHFADGLKYHDEAFASALTENFAKCADGMKQYKRILDLTKRGTIGLVT